MSAEKILKQLQANQQQLEALTDKVQELADCMGVKTFTKAEAAKMLNITPATLDKLRREGVINFAKTGRKVLFTIQDIKEYLENS